MKVSFYTIGCKVNQYETQALREQFLAAGYKIAEEDEPADVYIINTCTVTNLADRKSRQYIRKAKKRNPAAAVAVVGCFVQTNPEEAKAMEGVDIIAGTNEKSRLVEYVGEFFAGESNKTSHVIDPANLTSYEEMGIITSMDSRTRAYIKIQEGCDRFCSYCIIPYARGGIRSRGKEEILAEAEGLLRQGFRELVLTGINTALYGRENVTTSGINGLENLLLSLNDLPGEFRIRLSSLEPTVIDAAGIGRLLQYEKLCPHLHLSLQSGSSQVLKGMNRHYTPAEYKEIVAVLRKKDRHFGLTTDIIVGFPGETEETFMESLDLIREIGFLKVHVFPYSRRKGTPAADMTGQTPSEIKKDRSSRMNTAANIATKAALSDMIGTTRQVLFEEFDEKNKIISGHADNYAKVYCEVEDEKAAVSLLNRFVPIRFESLYKDGMKGIA